MPSPTSTFVSYCRVSTQQQGQSGLGLEAQRTAIEAFVEARRGTLVAEFVEVETGKGSNALDKRPQLRSALATAQKLRATLLIAKLDRLARNVHFVSGLIEADVDFVACDMPQANKVMLQIHAVMAEHERDQTSARTKAALAAARARGVRLGLTGPTNAGPSNAARALAAQRNAELLRDIVVPMTAAGASLRKIASALDAAGHRPAIGGRWHPSQIARLQSRLAAHAASHPQVQAGN